MVATTRARGRLPSQEELLERRIERDVAVHAAMRDGRNVTGVAREFGLTSEECRTIYGAIEYPNVMLENLAAARYRTRKREERAAARAAAPLDWPPPRVRNVLTREFGIPADRVADPACIVERVTRAEILAVPMAGTKTADSVAGFLAGHGLALRDA